MNIIAIGDIHNQIVEAEAIASKYENDHLIIFTGDYFDKFYDDPATAKRTAVWLKESLYKPNRIHCLGNHDGGYSFYSLVYGRNIFKCSGWTQGKQDAINEILTKEDWDKIKIFHYQYGWLFTHAGAHPYWFEHPIKGYSIESIIERLESTSKNYFDRVSDSLLYEAGRCRGGRSRAGGILWHDHNQEDQLIPNIKQVYGHTPTLHTAIDGGIDIVEENPSTINADIDCGLKEILKINEDGSIEIIDTGYPNFYSLY